MSGSYDFEEQERIAELKAWWEDNRWYVAGGVVAALLAFGGYRGWVHWSTQQAEDAAAMYTPVAEAAKGKDEKKTADAAQALIDKHPRSYFASESALVLAKNAFEAGHLDEAKKHLQAVPAKRLEEHPGPARIPLPPLLLDMQQTNPPLQP